MAFSCVSPDCTRVRFRFFTKPFHPPLDGDSDYFRLGITSYRGFSNASTIRACNTRPMLISKTVTPNRARATPVRVATTIPPVRQTGGYRVSLCCSVGRRRITAVSFHRSFEA
jgi:hypothetical protein